jgi:hypothetical protein
VSRLALQCLGEIGPIDLQSHILSVESEDSGPNDSLVIVKIIHHLIKFMTESTKEGMPKLAYEALFNILNTTADGRALDLKLLGRDTGAMVEPMRKSAKSMPKGRQPTTAANSEAELLAALEEPDLWISAGYDYATWLRNLVRVLLTAIPKNSVLGQLGPVCDASGALCEKVLPFLVHEV